MYACGITPYSESHLGHGVAAIRFNMIRRYLVSSGYDVKFVQNITNVDDKLINRGREIGRSPVLIAQQHSQEYAELQQALGIEAPDANPDVISFIPQIISYIEDLIRLGFAYATQEGNVYFDVRKKTDYGKLSGRSIDSMLDGVRITNEGDKRHPADFALWKQEEHEEMAWDSPWGRGRPGWHIECSVMSNAILGAQIDIHCGGLDLIFPHHENEIAQCEAHNDCAFSNFWVHSGLLNIDGQKMSKSLGNFLTLKEAISKYGAELIKLVVLKHHYRSDINLTDELFEDTLNQLLRTIRAFERIEETTQETPATEEVDKDFYAAMNDDFNTPIALVGLNKGLEVAIQLLDTDPKSAQAQNMLSRIKAHMNTLGLFMGKQGDNEQINTCLTFHAGYLRVPALTQSDILRFIEERANVKNAGNFARSDEIRDALHGQGIKLLDSRNKPTTWQFNILPK